MKKFMILALLVFFGQGIAYGETKPVADPQWSFIKEKFVKAPQSSLRKWQIGLVVGYKVVDRAIIALLRMISKRNRELAAYQFNYVKHPVTSLLNLGAETVLIFVAWKIAGYLFRAKVNRDHLRAFLTDCEKNRAETPENLRSFFAQEQKLFLQGKDAYLQQQTPRVFETVKKALEQASGLIVLKKDA